MSFPLPEHITVVTITDARAKQAAVESCDGAFPRPLTIRKNYSEILNKFQQYADFVVAYDGDSPIGYAAMYANDLSSKTAYISMIGVVDSRQHHHIGSAIMEQCLSIAKARGMCQIRLEVLDTNQKAIAFYKHFDFRFNGCCSPESHYMVKLLF